jgi:hypothetical protein
MSIVPLLQTRKSESVPALFIRYLETADYTKKWYDSDLLDKNSQGWKSLMAVRKKHQRVYEAMQKIECPYPDGTVWMSQYAMFVTQWAFIGLFMMFPEDCGLHFKSDEHREEVLKAANYLWRTIGYLHGVKDEFNMCHDDYRDTIDMCHVIHNELFMPLLIKGPEVSRLGYEMALDIVKSLREMLLSGTSGAVYMNYWYRIFGVPQEVTPTLSITEWIHLHGLSFLMRYMMKFDIMVRRVDYRSNQKFERTNRNKRKIREKLEKIDNEVKYTLEAYEKTKCPFALHLMPKAGDYVVAEDGTDPVGDDEKCPLDRDHNNNVLGMAA